MLLLEVKNMGILIRNKNEQIKFVSNQNMYFLNDDFLNLIQELLETIKKHNVLEQELNDKEKKQVQEKNRLEKLITEQKHIDAEIQSTLNSKVAAYKMLEQESSDKALTDINGQLNMLFNKLKQQGFHISQANTHIRHNSRTITNICERIQMAKNKIRLIESLFKAEYDKICWDRFDINTINFSIVFGVAINYELRLILRSILRKSLELENTTIQMIHKLCNKMLNKTNYSKTNFMFEQIKTLNKINNMIYDFVFELISRSNLSNETLPLLQQLDNFLDNIINYSKCSLNKNRTLNISNSIIRLRSVSELNRKVVINDCRPRIFYKKKLQFYNLDYQKVNVIMDEMILYLKATESQKDDRPKTYYLK